MGLLDKLKILASFLSQNKVIFVAAGLVILFIVILVMSFSASEPSIEKQAPTILPVRQSITPAPTISRTIQQRVDLVNPDTTWSPTQFTEEDFGNRPFTKTEQQDGTTKYTYSSSNPNRPNEITVQEGEIITQRVVVTNKYVYNYTNTLGAPDYVFESSKFYGTGTMIYVYLDKGIALVADDKTTEVKEQLTFKPTSYDDFKQKYAEDVADFTVLPVYEHR